MNVEISIVDNDSTNKFVINKYSTRIVRAGFGNILIPIFLIYMVLLNQLLIDLNMNLYLKMGSLIFSFIFFIVIYISNVSKIVVNDLSIKFTNPIYIKNVKKNEIRHIKIYPIRLSFCIVLVIKNTTKILPNVYFFITTDKTISYCIEWLKKINGVNIKI